MEITVSRKVKFHIPGCSQYTPLECGLTLTKEYDDSRSISECRKELGETLRQELAKEILCHVDASLPVLSIEDSDEFINALLEEVGEDG